MSIRPETIDAMIAAGASAEVIAAAWKAEIAVREIEVEDRRAKDRERQRRHRESRDVTVTDSDVTLAALDKEIPQTPKEIKPSPCVRETRARGWHRLPEDWQPRALPSPVQAKVDQWPPGTLDDEFAAFRRWAANAENKNGKGRKLDWDQAWRNWIGRRHDERYSRVSMGRHQSSDGISSTARAGLAVFGSEASH